MQVNFKIISQGPHLSERKLGHRLFPSSIIKHEITRHFHIVVVQGWQRNVQKRVLYIQSCCNLLLNKPTAFLTFQLPLPSYLLKLPIFDQYGRFITASTHVCSPFASLGGCSSLQGTPQNWQILHSATSHSTTWERQCFQTTKKFLKITYT